MTTTMTIEKPEIRITHSEREAWEVFGDSKCVEQKFDPNQLLTVSRAVCKINGRSYDVVEIYDHKKQPGFKEQFQRLAEEAYKKTCDVIENG